MEFKDKNKKIILKSTENTDKKIAFVQNLYDKAWEKINHFDKLRQQNLNYALIIFSGLLAFIIKTESIQMQVLGCVGIVLLMFIFCRLDHRYHTYTHGFTSSILIFTQVIAYLLDMHKDDVEFYQYHTEGEQKAKWRESLQTRIYILLMLAGFLLTAMILLKIL